MIAVPNLEELQAKLQDIRAKYGEEMFADSARDLAQILSEREGEYSEMAQAVSELMGVCKSAEQVKETPKSAPETVPRMPPKSTQDEALRSFLVASARQQMPSLKSQAQFDAMEATLNITCKLADAIFRSDLESVKQAKEALEKAIGALHTATDLTYKLQEMAEAEKSPTANAFSTEPKEMREGEVYETLLSELGGLKTIGSLNIWYVKNKGRMDVIVTQKSRNDIFDRIRKLKETLVESDRG